MYIDEIHDLLSSSNIFRMTKPRRKSWAEHVAFTGEIRGSHRVLLGKPEKKDHLEDLGVGGNVGFKWIKNIRLVALIRSIWLRLGKRDRFL
jgi:hypothetical protein